MSSGARPSHFPHHLTLISDLGLRARAPTRGTGRARAHKCVKFGIPFLMRQTSAVWISLRQRILHLNLTPAPAMPVGRGMSHFDTQVVMLRGHNSPFPSRPVCGSLTTSLPARSPRLGDILLKCIQDSDTGICFICEDHRYLQYSLVNKMFWKNR